MKKCLLCLLMITLLLCACQAAPPDAASEAASEAQPEAASEAQPDAQPEAQTLILRGDAIPGGEAVISLDALAAENSVSAVYSTINNWPAKKFYAARGLPLADILSAAAVDEYAVLTIVSADGYQLSLTYEQLTQPRWHYPGLDADDTAGAESVPAMIALSYCEDSRDLAEIREDAPMFIFGMSNIFEHTNPAFIKNIAEIIVSAAPPGQWPPVTIYPPAGPFQVGDKIKLQHESFGLVKIFYTLDGSEPTPQSAMYNPSTFQPELNAPLTVDGDMLIKTLCVGYGKADSEIAVYEIKIAE